MITVQIINQSTVAKDSDLEKIVAALQIQVTRDFAPAWNHAGATVQYVPAGTTTGTTPGLGAWPLYVMDHSPEQGALGYHEDLGKPVGRVFAADEMRYGSSLSVTMSHELLEMLVDPLTQLTAYRQSDNRLYCLEDCDAVESDDYGYKIDGVLVSDFVLPSWFADGSAHPYDYKGHCSKPFEVLPGGYIGYLDLGNGCSWQDLTADGHNVAERKRPGSRYWRRRALYGRIQP